MALLKLEWHLKVSQLPNNLKPQTGFQPFLWFDTSKLVQTFHMIWHLKVGSNLSYDLTPQSWFKPSLWFETLLTNDNTQLRCWTSVWGDAAEENQLSFFGAFDCCGLPIVPIVPIAVSSHCQFHQPTCYSSQARTLSSLPWPPIKLLNFVITSHTLHLCYSCSSNFEYEAKHVCPL